MNFDLVWWLRPVADYFDHGPALGGQGDLCTGLRRRPSQCHHGSADPHDHKALLIWIIVGDYLPLPDRAVVAVRRDCLRITVDDPGHLGSVATRAARLGHAIEAWSGALNEGLHAT